jgi:hypothetical protein
MPCLERYAYFHKIARSFSLRYILIMLLNTGHLWNAS